MAIAVTGATGFVGGHLVDRLIQRHEVKALVRKTSNTQRLEEQGVELVYGDMLNVDSLERLVNDVSVVYHVAAQVYKGSFSDFWNANFRGTVNLLKACLGKSLDRIVHTSTIGVTGSIKNPPGDESHPYNPSSPYDYSKCEAEKMVLKHHREYGLPVTIVRPAAVYGPRNKLFFRLFEWLEKGLFPLIGRMNNLTHTSYVENLADGTILAGERKQAIGEVYIIADEKPVTWRQYFHEFARVIGVSPPKISVPVTLVKLSALVSELQSSMFGGEPFLTRYWVDELTKTYAYDITKAKRELGYIPKVSLREGIKRTFEYYTSTHTHK